MTIPMQIDYSEYLKLEKLLDLQNGYSEFDTELSSAEMHFIVANQTLELWFKLILREMRAVRALLDTQGNPNETVSLVAGRCRQIRDLFYNAAASYEPHKQTTLSLSNVKSVQLTQIEIVLGWEEEMIETTIGLANSLFITDPDINNDGVGQWGWGQIRTARRERTIRTALYDWFGRWSNAFMDDDAGASCVDKFLTGYLEAISRDHSIQIERLLQNPYSKRSALCTQFDELYRHAQSFLMALDRIESQRRRVRRIRAALLYVETYFDIDGLAPARLLVDSLLDLESILLFGRGRYERKVVQHAAGAVGTDRSWATYRHQNSGLHVFGDLWTARSMEISRPLAEAIKPKPGIVHVEM